MARLFRKRVAGVAVVELHGVIGTRLWESVYARLFSDLAANNRYKAVLLDIESPGGSAAACQV